MHLVIAKLRITVVLNIRQAKAITCIKNHILILIAQAHGERKTERMQVWICINSKSRGHIIRADACINASALMNDNLWLQTRLYSKTTPNINIRQHWDCDTIEVSPEIISQGNIIGFFPIRYRQALRIIVASLAGIESPDGETKEIRKLILSFNACREADIRLTLGRNK
jgi:hypothetical protein